MRQTRIGNFVGQNMSDEQIKKKVDTLIGQGDWKVTWHVSGSVVNWVAEKTTTPQGPQGMEGLSKQP